MARFFPQAGTFCSDLQKFPSAPLSLFLFLPHRSPRSKNRIQSSRTASRSEAETQFLSFSLHTHSARFGRKSPDHPTFLCILSSGTSRGKKERRNVRTCREAWPAIKAVQSPAGFSSFIHRLPTFFLTEKSRHLLALPRRHATPTSPRLHSPSTPVGISPSLYLSSFLLLLSL